MLQAKEELQELANNDQKESVEPQLTQKVVRGQDQLVAITKQPSED